MQIGIVLPHLGPSQAAYYAVQAINKNIDKHEFILFYENIMPVCLKPLCPIMNSTEIWSFNGLLITTNMSSTISALKGINNSKILYYLWDLSFMRGKSDFITNSGVMNSDKIQLAARSKSHQKVIQNYCNREVNHIFPDFETDYDKLCKSI